MEKLSLILGYDRFTDEEDPLLNIIQCLWNNGIDPIHRFLASTLEFTLFADNKDTMEKKVIMLKEELEKLAFIRLYVATGVVGDGNSELDKTLQTYIKDKTLFGLLKRPKGWNG